MRFDEFSDKLYYLRKDRKMSLEELATATGISKTTLGKIENEYVDTSFRNIVTLANYYGVSIDYLLGLKRDEKIEKTEISDLGLSDKAIAKLTEDKHHAQLISILISSEKFDEFLNRLELLLDRSMEQIYSGLNQYYENAVHRIETKSDGKLPTDEISNILEHLHFDDSFDRFKLHEMLDVLIDELQNKYGNELSADNSVNSSLNVLLRSAAATTNDEQIKKPQLRDILADMVEASPEESRAMLYGMIDAIDTALHMQNYTVKKIKY